MLLLVAATATAAAAAALPVPAVVVFVVFLVRDVVFDILFVVVVVLVIDDRVELRRLRRARAGTAHAHLGAFVFAFGQDFDRHVVAVFDLLQVCPLGVEQIYSRFGAGLELDDRALALGRFILDQAERREAGARRGADQAGPVAMRAFAGGRFQHACAQALAAHFHQPEAGDAAHLDPRPIVLQRILHGALDLPDIGIVFHIDEVDHDQPGHVAQAQLTGDFPCCFDIGRRRGLLDPVFLGRATRVDVDRDQRLCRVDDQIAARFELHDGVVHSAQLVFRAVALEQRDRIRIGFHPPSMARHQQLHEALGELVAFLAFDHDFLDLAVVDVADGALDEIAVGMDQARRAG